MKTEKSGKYLLNSRVDVDYTSGKPKIKFDYPPSKSKKSLKERSERNAITGSKYFGLLLAVLTCVGLLCYFYLFYYSYGDYPTSCNSTSFSNGTDESRINITCDTGNYTLKYNPYTRNDKWDETQEEIWLEAAMKIGTIIFIAILSYFLAFFIIKFLSKRKGYKEKFPEMNAKGVKMKYYKFTTKDVENNLCEIPSFLNVVLEYKTSGDFSEYLTNIKIREHKWHYVKRRKGKYKIGKLEKQSSNWYARFYFSQTPKSGWLKVYYH